LRILFLRILFLRILFLRIFRNIQFLAEIEVEKFKSDYHIYVLHRGGEMIFDEAVKYCESFGMKIIFPQDDEQTKELLKLEYGQFWIAITDSASDGNWTNIYTGEKPKWYTKWKEGEPNGNGEDHAIFNTDNGGLWTDVKGSNKYNTLCIKGIYIIYFELKEHHR